MPLIKSAKKKLRRDRRQAVHNQQIKDSLDRLIKQMRRAPSDKLLAIVTSHLDKAAKVNLIHANKAARLKSHLAKLVAKPKLAAPVKQTAKTPSKKASKK